jgi:DNA-binding transcriptional ArsR family regulator
MVKYHETALDRTFAALADPTRRALLAQLGETHDATISELARPFPISLPAVMKHLDVLTEAGLVSRTKTGRSVSCQLKAAPMEDAMLWLIRYQRFWSQQLDRLTAFVEEQSCLPAPARPLPKSPVSPSSVISMRGRKRSSRPGRTPRR